MRTRLRAGLRAAILVAATAAAAGSHAAEAPVEIRWEQLVPGREAAATSPAPWGTVRHGQLDPAADPAGDPVALATEYDGKDVRIAGFLVPIDFDGMVTKEFLLVPYMGACVHVPPPPPNQIIHVRSAEGVAVEGLFDAVTVTGRLTAAPVATEIADVGYQIAAEAVVPYQAP